MSEPLHSPHDTSNDWTARIAQRYRCKLSAELADWFDSEIWKQAGRSEYHVAIDPCTLLEAAPDEIWPGLMCSDLLPLISNSAGDWLCVRVDDQNVASEIVQWYHGGGDWIPWGKNLAEALAFDALVDRLPGESRRHAVPAEDPRPARSDHRRSGDPFVDWALSHLPDSVRGAFDIDAEPSDIAKMLLDANVAEIAVRCELVLSALMEPKRNYEQLLRADSNVSRNQLAEWSFDIDRAPAPIRDRLAKQNPSLAKHQDWDAACALASRVNSIAPDLAWAWDVVGYAAERRGDIPDAVSAYRNSAKCSVFTDQSVRLETHWATDQSAKFSVSRLVHLVPEEARQDLYLRILCDEDANRRSRETTNYWMDQATKFEASGDPGQAYRCFIAAAWDVGAAPITAYSDLLKHIAETAQSSGQESRAEVARTHRSCLRDRYGI